MTTVRAGIWDLGSGKLRHPSNAGELFKPRYQGYRQVNPVLAVLGPGWTGTRGPDMALTRDLGRFEPILRNKIGVVCPDRGHPDADDALFAPHHADNRMIGLFKFWGFT